MKKNKQSCRDLWDTTKCSNTEMTGVPRGEKKQKGAGRTPEEIKTKILNV